MERRCHRRKLPVSESDQRGGIEFRKIDPSSGSDDRKCAQHDLPQHSYVAIGVGLRCRRNVTEPAQHDERSPKLRRYVA